jgi:hypothetical protein
VIFNNVIFFQVYDELNHIESNEEEFDNGIIRTYKKSNLLEYIKNNTLISFKFGKHFNSYKHYRVITSADWFDIITRHEPIIKLVNNNE